jgi:hypothetical protein
VPLLGMCWLSWSAVFKVRYRHTDVPLLGMRWLSGVPCRRGWLGRNTRRQSMQSNGCRTRDARAATMALNASRIGEVSESVTQHHSLRGYAMG